MNLSRLYGNPAFLQLLPSEREVYLLIQAYKLAQKPEQMNTKLAAITGHLVDEIGRIVERLYEAELLGVNAVSKNAAKCRAYRERKKKLHSQTVEGGANPPQAPIDPSPKPTRPITPPTEPTPKTAPQNAIEEPASTISGELLERSSEGVTSDSVLVETTATNPAENQQQTLFSEEHRRESEGTNRKKSTKKRGISRVTPPTHVSTPVSTPTKTAKKALSNRPDTLPEVGTYAHDVLLLLQSRPHVYNLIVNPGLFASELTDENGFPNVDVIPNVTKALNWAAENKPDLKEPKRFLRNWLSKAHPIAPGVQKTRFHGGSRFTSHPALTVSTPSHDTVSTQSGGVDTESRHRAGVVARNRSIDGTFRAHSDKPLDAVQSPGVTWYDRAKAVTLAKRVVKNVDVAASVNCRFVDYAWAHAVKDQSQEYWINQFNIFSEKETSSAT